jgi:sugar diacid utilization regulator/putative methionine-R-sulfoxide reductase with GAF domain
MEITASPAEPAAEAAARRIYASLIEIGNQIQADVELESVLAFIVESAREVMSTELSWLALVDDAGRALRVHVANGDRTRNFSRMEVPADRGVGGMAIASRQTIAIEDYRRFEHLTTGPARRSVLAEGVAGMMCAPMFRGSKVVGALYAANREPTRFTASDVSLLTTLATQASIAIDNARLVNNFQKALQEANRLNTLLEGKNRLLEDSDAIHHELTGAMLAGMRVDQLGDVLARLVRRQIVIRQDVCPPFVTRHSPRPVRAPGPSGGRADTRWHDAEPAALETHKTPIVAGPVYLGEIAVSGKGRLTDLGRRALEHGATVLALELLKQREIQAIEERLEGDVLSALLDEVGPPSPALAQRALRIGFDVQQPHYLVVVQRERGGGDSMRPRDLSALTARAFGPAQRILAVAQGWRGVFAVPASPSPRIEETAEQLLAGLPEPTFAGVSGRTGPGRDYHTAYSEALACVRLAQSFRAASGVVTYEGLGAMRFLLDGGSVEYTADVIDEWLGPLLEHDRARHGRFVPTLRAYLDADGHHPTAAAACHVHVSTLKYRLGVIRRVLGRPLWDPDVRFGLRVAFRLLDILQPRAKGESARDRRAGGGHPAPVVAGS